MGQPIFRDDLNSILAEINRRLASLETAPRATNTSVRQGTFSILSATGAPLVILGVLPNGATGILVQNANGRALMDVDTVNGWGEPFFILPMVPSLSAVQSTVVPFAVTTSTSMTEVYLCDFWASGGKLVLNVWAYIDTATSMDWQITAQETASWVNGNVSGTETTVASGTGVTTTTALNPGGGVGVDIPVGAISPGRSGTDPRGGVYRLRFKARIAGGSGHASLAPLVNPFNYG